VEILLQPT